MNVFRPILKAHKLTEQQWRVIRILHETGGLEFHQLATIACILRPSLTGIVNRLEKANLVHRERSLSDQRKLYVSLSELGCKRFEVLMPAIDQAYRERVEKRISVEEFRQLLDLLEKIRAPNEQPHHGDKAEPTRASVTVQE